MTIELDKDQRDILQVLFESAKSGKEQQTLGGYAGVGKSVLISYLKQLLPGFAVCAYTGKAANVLRKKGVPASTIHSLIYTPFEENGELRFVLRQSLDCGGIIVDESSMVGEDIYYDLKSFGLPMIFVGDHGQLEPVNSNFNLMKNPEYRLEKIHRNAGEISEFAEWLRLERPATQFRSKGQVHFLRRYDLDDNTLASREQVICAYNKTRTDTNRRIRKTLGLDGIIVPGERAMCLRNDRRLGLFNGMQGVVNGVRIRNKKIDIDFEACEQSFKGIPVDAEQFGMETTKKNLRKDDPHPFDYAYCITAHKSMGDEWDDVMVFEQKCSKWEHKRWAYTAASRAKKTLYWVTGM